MALYSGARLIVFGTLVLSSLACSKNEGAANASPPAQAEAVAAPAPAAEPAADFKAEAETMFRTRCVVCHGEKGLGDGPGAAALNPKPRNYTDATWQASVTDEQIGNTILNGGAAVGKSPIMPASPDLLSRPEVVTELVKIVRHFKQ
jgi:mono/diheme cytochrome c family protein